MRRFRSLLFMPGNNPGMLANSPFLGADMVIFDLEDAVAQAEKDAARSLVRHALGAVGFGSVGVVVRINGLDTPYWEKDMDAAVRGGADMVLVPKIDSPGMVAEACALMVAKEAEYGAEEGRTGMIALVESAVGIENAHAVATAHTRLRGILLGAEDLTVALQAKRTPSGEEIRYARSRVLMACKAGGITAIDTPYPFVSDMEGLAADAAFAAQLGFDGKAVISPHHVHCVNEAFSPSPAQVRWAERVLAVARQAEKDGKGAVSLDGMMIDLPVIKRAERIALLAGIVAEDSNAG